MCGHQAWSMVCDQYIPYACVGAGGSDRCGQEQGGSLWVVIGLPRACPWCVSLKMGGGAVCQDLLWFCLGGHGKIALLTKAPAQPSSVSAHTGGQPLRWALRGLTCCPGHAGLSP